MQGFVIADLIQAYIQYLVNARARQPQQQQQMPPPSDADNDGDAAEE